MVLTGEKGYHSVASGARHHLIIGLVINLDDKTVQMDIDDIRNSFEGALCFSFGSAAAVCARCTGN